MRLFYTRKGGAGLRAGPSRRAPEYSRINQNPPPNSPVTVKDRGFGLTFSRAKRMVHGERLDVWRFRFYALRHSQRDDILMVDQGLSASSYFNAV